MPASNSEARKRHEAEAATTDALAEALSNVAAGVVLEVTDIIRCPTVHHDTKERCALAVRHAGPHCGGDICWPAIPRHVVAAMQTRAAEMFAHGHEPTVHTMRRAAMRVYPEVDWRQASAEWHCALDVEARRIIGRSL